MKKISIATAVSAMALLIATSCSCGNNSGKTAETKAASDSTAVTDTAALKEQNWKKMTAGYAVPDFKLKDLQGKEVSLADLKGKYALLDFWGTWCRYCVMGLPQMKEYYAKYSDRIEFVGIDCRETEEAWRAGVEKYGLTWTNLYNGYDQSLIVGYGIQGYPSKIIIDSEGKVVEAFLGEDPALYTKLDEMFR
ncbi:MAG: TlpA family protein disulfide reductase [Bacteroidetes bacterium]|uniref:TlpA family protein disulfide reductase n=1 Tax=Candidatus Cryptobacteroides intestinigallinarum TaxID=2840767 RepID=A0A9D9HKC4_9BACT|nr:TlpA family protein disulfide reductase [Candidatus Cryptobacteroides intestinigallinarum]